jgi:hypothetical protein
MLGVLVNDRCNRRMANDIYAAADEHEALRREVAPEEIQAGAM